MRKSHDGEKKNGKKKERKKEKRRMKIVATTSLLKRPKDKDNGEKL